MAGPMQGPQDSTPPAAPFSPPPYDQAPALPPAPQPPVSAPRRPVQVVLATIGLGLIGLVELLQGGWTLVDALQFARGLDVFMLWRVLARVLLSLGLLVSMGLVISGRDGGRLVAAAFSGVAAWIWFNGLSIALPELFGEHAVGWNVILFVAITLLVVLVGILLIAMLAGRAAGDWFHHKRAARGSSPQPAPSYGMPGSV